jgi:REP element-mobilizing transposase RayT
LGSRSDLGRCDTAAHDERLSAAEVPYIAARLRGNTAYSCCFIASSTFQKRNILQSDRMAGLLVDVLVHCRALGKYLLHEFVVMPDHFHLLISPGESLERAMQLIKAGFSFRANRELGFVHEMWQPSFYDRRWGMQENISAFESTFGRILVSVGWQ